LELLYWPTLQMLIWGFMSQFLYSNSSYVFRAFGVLLAAVMLWDVLFRGQLGLSMSFLEEMWARNLGHLFVTPLRPYEWVLSLLSMSMIRVLLGIADIKFMTSARRTPSRGTSSHRRIITCRSSALRNR